MAVEPPPSQPQESSAEGSLRPAPESVLAVDLGTAFTKAALFEPVEGQYRLIAAGQARTTAETHIYEGLQQACSQIASLTGRQLFSGGEPLAGEVSGGRGVEVLAVSLSCYPPLRVLATNDAAAVAAQAQRCYVEVLPVGAPAAQIASANIGRWDAIAGPEDEILRARALLGLGEQGPAAVSGDTATMQRSLGELAVKLAQERVPGLPDLAGMATEPLTTVSAALLELARLVASRFGLRLAIADCGSSQASVVRATPEQSSARLILYDQPLRDIPTTRGDMSAMHRRLEGVLRQCVAERFTADVAIATGALARCGHWSEPALTMLNGIQPAGVIQFAIDGANIVSQIAVLANPLPDIACRIFEQDGIIGLGAAVCPRGNVKPGAKAVEVRLQFEDETEQQRDVNFGELVRIPLAPGRKASLSLYPVKQVDVGLNRPGVAATAHIDGGRVGLMVDARDAEGRDQRQPWEDSLT